MNCLLLVSPANQPPHPGTIMEHESDKHVYTKVITITSWIFSGLGVIGGLAILVFLFSDAESKKEIKAAVTAPLLLGGTGYLLGMALAFLFAPASFLTAPAGKKWLDKVGTKTVGAARVVCAIFAVLAIGLFSVLTWAALTGNF